MGADSALSGIVQSKEKKIGLVIEIFGCLFSFRKKVAKTHNQKRSTSSKFNAVVVQLV